MNLLRSRRGTLAKVAVALGLSRGAVAVWEQVPEKHLAAVVAATGIPASDLRPDLAALFRADANPPEAA